MKTVMSPSEMSTRLVAREEGATEIEGLPDAHVVNSRLAANQSLETELRIYFSCVSIRSGV